MCTPPYQNSMVIFMILKVSSIKFAMSSKRIWGETHIFLRVLRCLCSALFCKILKKNSSDSTTIMIMEIYFISKVSQITSNHQIGHTGCFDILKPNILRNYDCFSFFSIITSYWINQGVNFTKSRIFQKVFVNTVWNFFNCSQCELEWTKNI